MLEHNRGCTAEQLAGLLHTMQMRVTPRAVAKRKGIEEFFIGYGESSTGRPPKLYSREALKLWQAKNTDVDEPTRARRLRSDVGAPRFCELPEWQLIVERTKSLYLRSADANLKLACEHAVAQLQREGLIDLEIRAQQVYRRLFQDARDPHTGLHTSEYHRQNWRAIHTGEYRRLDTAQRMPTLNYDMQAMLESMSIAGPGFGALAFWAIDGHKAHTQALPDELADSTSLRDLSSPFFICITDVLTGMVLWVERCESESERTVISALVNCMCLWNATPTHGIAMDGGIANATKNVRGLISAMLPPEAFVFAQQYPGVYTKGSPIVINPPYMPDSFAKGALERMFGKVSKEHDAPRFPDNFQGGSRLTAVQRRISNQPTVTANTPTISEYFASLDNYLYSDYIERERAQQFPTLVQRGIKPTIRNVFDYYGGNDRAAEMPSGERIAKMLYYISEHRAFVKAQQGGAEAQINKQTWNVICRELTHEYWGKHIAIVPVPGHDGLAVVLSAKDKAKTSLDDVRFIGFGHSSTVRTYDDMERMKRIQWDARNHVHAHLTAERMNIEEAKWHNLSEPMERPTLPAHDLLNTDAPKLPAVEVLSIDDDPPELDTRANRLLKRISSNL